ncbi:family 20 glycosylhydrolase [Pontibacter beigongshangensis]|uniref:family 20 glycosylhydrolase n=1 Tax=Pontibacter beigongshangensis TaxID=2574733 RepID=UPI00164FC598|nr:family 20 glycosylhydrolase [Pontibacter beigongshangensis]
MGKIILLFSFSWFIHLTAFAQDAPFDVSKLEVKWELIENNYQGKRQFLAAFTITNKSTSTLEADSWKMYFSYTRVITKSLTGQVKFSTINGEFASMVPGPGFKRLAPAASIKITYLASGRSLKYTDAPAGLYLVWDHAPGKGYAVQNYTVAAVPAKEREILKRPVRQIYDLNKASRDIPLSQLQPILPSPVTYAAKEGSFLLTPETVLVYDAAFGHEAQVLQQEVEAITGKRLPPGTPAHPRAITLKKEAGLDPEGYTLSIRLGGITIAASAPAGMFYGIQSLKMMLPPDSWRVVKPPLRIQAAEITDAPRFGYRSFMLDVARNFQTKQEVLKLLDLLALYKLNTLHFHLNDDEGWRLEIPSLPELTTVGARRGHTLTDKDHLPPAYGSGPDTSAFPGSGFYTRADFIEILQYAKARHIRVIPEIETPGHARAAIKAMDARYERLKQEGNPTEASRYLLRDTLDQSVYKSVQGYSDNVMNVALPSTYAFMERVVDDIVAMYAAAGAPLQTIHVGGDEVPAGVWQKSPAILQLMKTGSMGSFDDLWYYYLARASKILQARNLYLSGWEEVTMRKTRQQGSARYVANPDFREDNFHAYVWNNVWGWGSEDLAYRLANAGYKVVLAPVTNFYFDQSYEKDADEPGPYWGSYVDVDKAFYFIPLDYYKSAKEDVAGNPLDTSTFIGKERLTAAGAANIVGLQCQLWSEKIRGADQLEYMLLPKLLGFAERAWAKNPAWATLADPEKAAAAYAKDWTWFVNITGKKELPRLDRYAGGFNYRIPPAGIRQIDGKVHANVQLPGFTIRYTTDGSVPTTTSKEYTEPLAAKGTFTFRVFNTLGRGSRVTTFSHKEGE